MLGGSCGRRTSHDPHFINKPHAIHKLAEVFVILHFHYFGSGKSHAPFLGGAHGGIVFLYLT